MRIVLILNPTSGTSMMADTHDSPETNEEMILAALRAYGIEPALFPAAEEIKRSDILSIVRGVFSGLFTLFTFQTTKLKLSLSHRNR